MADTAPHASTESAGPDLSGKRLGAFRLVRRLGRGAMAEVYLAEQESLKRQVAVKVLKGQLASDRTYVQRFHNEARAAAALVHANIVQIHEVGCEEGVHFIAQEYVAGQNLQEYLTRRGPPPLGQAVAIIRQVAAALQKAAEKGIVHRDIKPENIMLARTGEVKVADFGLARLAADQDTLHLTQVGITMGTPLYVSPEQVEGRALDSRTDLYSLGVTAYHMLAGRPPFQGDTPLSVAVQHLKSPPERIEELRPDLPPALGRIVHRLLAKDPAQRYASPRELQVELRGLAQELGQEGWQAEFDDLDDDRDLAAGRSEATGRLAAVMQTSDLRILRRRRLAWVWAAAGVAVFVLGGATAWLVREPFLLADAQGELPPKQPSVEMQLAYAKMNWTEPWLLSVEAHYPEETYAVRRAKQELARLYLTNDRFADALSLFEELANIPEEPEFQAFGLAGQAFIHAARQEYAEAMAALARFNPIRESLKDPAMMRVVRETLASAGRAMNSAASKEVSTWLENLPEEDGEETAPAG